MNGLFTYLKNTSLTFRIILPMLIDASRKLFTDYQLNSDDTDSLSEVIVPVTFNFPNTGKSSKLTITGYSAKAPKRRNPGGQSARTCSAGGKTKTP